MRAPCWVRRRSWGCPRTTRRRWRPRPASRWITSRWAPCSRRSRNPTPTPSSAWPARSYYFRDFTVTFYPLRLFQARELAAGRWPFWNPYIQEGAFALPASYPLDMLHIFWPGPAAVSWLLTLHFPLAAIAAHWLARELGASRKAAAVAGALYA